MDMEDPAVVALLVMWGWGVILFFMVGFQEKEMRKALQVKSAMK